MGEEQKNMRARENYKKKNSCTPINPKKIFMLWPNKNSYKEFDNGKNPCGSKISLPPPHNSSSGPSLKHVTVTKKTDKLMAHSGHRR